VTVKAINTGLKILSRMSYRLGTMLCWVRWWLSRCRSLSHHKNHRDDLYTIFIISPIYLMNEILKIKQAINFFSCSWVTEKQPSKTYSFSSLISTLTYMMLSTFYFYFTCTTIMYFSDDSDEFCYFMGLIISICMVIDIRLWLLRMNGF